MMAESHRYDLMEKVRLSFAGQKATSATEGPGSPTAVFAAPEHVHSSSSPVFDNADHDQPSGEPAHVFDDAHRDRPSGEPAHVFDSHERDRPSGAPAHVFDSSDKDNRPALRRPSSERPRCATRETRKT